MGQGSELVWAGSMDVAWSRECRLCDIVNVILVTKQGQLLMTACLLLTWRDDKQLKHWQDAYHRCFMHGCLWWALLQLYFISTSLCQTLAAADGQQCAWC
jgi:hypothetical protein